MKRKKGKLTCVCIACVDIMYDAMQETSDESIAEERRRKAFAAHY